jgi:hypothetical protein
LHKIEQTLAPDFYSNDNVLYFINFKNVWDKTVDAWYLYDATLFALVVKLNFGYGKREVA